MKPKIHLVTLGVEDLARSLRFYRDGLGWPTSSASTDDVAFLPLGGVVLALWGRGSLAEDARVDGRGSGFRGIALAHNVGSPEEVDEALRAAERAGGTVTKPGQKVFWGGYSGYFADPDGHLWEVAHNPFWSFDSSGNVVLP